MSQVLPFGASASVFSFNRLSKAIQLVGTRLFGLVWSSYIDDYTQFDIAPSGDSAQRTAESFLDLIGWKYSRKDSKRLPMSNVFTVLGVEVDLRRSRFGEIVVKNKKARVEQICCDIDAVLAEGHFPANLASSLRGRLQFAESQTFGRAVSLHMKACHSRAMQQRGRYQAPSSVKLCPTSYSGPRSF